MRTFVQLLAGLLLLTAASCGGGAVPRETALHSIRGITDLNEPVVNATVQIYDTNNKLIAAKTSATHTSGTFLFRIPEDEFVNDFRIEVTGGTVGVGGQPFLGTLRSEVRGHDHDAHSYYHVGPVNTLISAYVQAHPEIPYVDAVSRVLAFLEIPKTVDPHTDLYAYADHFHPDVFMAEAKMAGGLDAYLARLVGEIDAGGTRPHVASASTYRALSVGGVGGKILGAVFVQLAKGAAGKGMGMLLDAAIGGGNQDVLDAMAEETKLIIDLKAEVEKLQNQSENAKNQILSNSDRNTYNIIVATLQGPASSILSKYQQLLWLSVADPNDSGYVPQAQALKVAIQMADPLAALFQINSTLVGAAGAEGAMEIWGRSVVAKSLPPSNLSAVLQQQYGYWVGIQLAALTLVLEDGHSRTQGTLQNYISTYANSVRSQGAVYRKWLLMHMAVLHEGADWNGFPSRPFFDEVGFPAMRNDQQYAGAPTLKDADAFIAQAVGETPTTKMYVVLSMGDRPTESGGWVSFSPFQGTAENEMATGGPIRWWCDGIQDHIEGTRVIVDGQYPTIPNVTLPSSVRFAIFDYGALPANVGDCDIRYEWDDDYSDSYSYFPNGGFRYGNPYIPYFLSNYHIGVNNLHASIFAWAWASQNPNLNRDYWPDDD